MNKPAEFLINLAKKHGADVEVDILKKDEACFGIGNFVFCLFGERLFVAYLEEEKTRHLFDGHYLDVRSAGLLLEALNDRS